MPRPSTTLYHSGRVLEIGCWAHTQRGFVKPFMIDTAAALTIALIQQLYDGECDAADLEPEGRRALRQERSLTREQPVLSPNRDDPQMIFVAIVVDRETAVLGEAL